MFSEGRIETTFQGYLVIVGLDKAGKHRLLDQQFTLETNNQVEKKQKALCLRVFVVKALVFFQAKDAAGKRPTWSWLHRFPWGYDRQ